jgi:glycosyltransferase involved in cell wall biosynthesis
MTIVVLKAGVTAKPVILTNKCGFDKATNADGGIVVDASVEGMVTGLLEYANHKDKFRQMGEHLNCMTVALHTWDQIIDRTTSYYRDITYKARRMESELQSGYIVSTVLKD